MNLLNVDVDLASCSVFDLLLELVDLSPFAADDDARTRGVDDDLQLVSRALDVNVRNARASEPTLQFFLQLQVFVQEIGIIALGDPVRMPGTIEAQSESIRMNFLTHDSS